MIWGCREKTGRGGRKGARVEMIDGNLMATGGCKEESWERREGRTKTHFGNHGLKEGEEVRRVRMEKKDTSATDINVKISQ